MAKIVYRATAPLFLPDVLRNSLLSDLMVATGKLNRSLELTIYSMASCKMLLQDERESSYLRRSSGLLLFYEVFPSLLLTRFFRPSICFYHCMYK